MTTLKSECLFKLKQDKPRIDGMFDLSKSIKPNAILENLNKKILENVSKHIVIPLLKDLHNYVARYKKNIYYKIPC